MQLNYQVSDPPSVLQPRSLFYFKCYGLDHRAEKCDCPNCCGLHGVPKVGQEKREVKPGRMAGVKWWIEGSSAQYESSWVVRWWANNPPVSIMKEGFCEEQSHQQANCELSSRSSSNGKKKKNLKPSEISVNFPTLKGSTHTHTRHKSIHLKPPYWLLVIKVPH